MRKKKLRFPLEKLHLVSLSKEPNQISHFTLVKLFFFIRSWGDNLINPVGSYANVIILLNQLNDLLLEMFPIKNGFTKV